MRKFSYLAAVLVISIFIAPYALAQKTLAEQIRDQAVAGDNQSSNSTQIYYFDDQDAAIKSDNDSRNPYADPYRQVQPAPGEYAPQTARCPDGSVAILGQCY